MGVSMAGSANTALDEIIATVLEAQLEDVDAETVQNAKDRVLDTVGCLIGGAADPSNPELVKLVKDYGGRPQATILMYGGKVPAGNAAMVNCILCRSFDYEPVSPVVSEKIRLKVFLTKKAVTAVMRRGSLRLQLVAVLQVKTRCRAVLLPMTTCFPSPPA